MVSNEQSGAFSCTFAGGQAQRRRWGKRGDFHSNSQVPSCHVWAEIGAVSTGTT